MEARSTNVLGFVHFQGDIQSNVASSHGVSLQGGSTGGVVTAFGDDASIALTVTPKGAGPFTLGTSSNTLTFGSTRVVLSTGSILMVGSTAPFGGFIRAIDTAASTPAVFNDTEAGRVAETTHTITGVSSQTLGTPADNFVYAMSQNLPAAVAIADAWVGSTANQVHCRMVKGSTIAVAAATCTIQFLVTRF